MSEEGKRIGCTVPSPVVLGGFLCGAYRGFCDAQNIPIENKSLESLLTWGPTILGGAATSIAFGLVGMIYGAMENYGYEKRIDVISAGLGTAIGGVAGAVIGAAVGGLGTLVGYGTGYVCGKVF